jgi:hypothetical protein
MNATSEVQPHLIVWQVGINDALAQAEVAPFAEALDEVLRWAPTRLILPTTVHSRLGERRPFQGTDRRDQFEPLPSEIAKVADSCPETRQVRWPRGLRRAVCAPGPKVRTCRPPVIGIACPDAVEGLSRARRVRCTFSRT